jgi:hypothetical protein
VAPKETFFVRLGAHTQEGPVLLVQRRAADAFIELLKKIGLDRKPIVGRM